jgi:hypothetical protein
LARALPFFSEKRSHRLDFLEEKVSEGEERV